MDYVEIQSKLDFVRNQLQQYAGLKNEQGSTFFVCCPFHAEKTPSFRIFIGPDTKSPGYGKCYGCGEKAGWDKIAPLLGLKPYKKGKPEVEYANLNILPTEIDDDDQDADTNFIQEPMEFSELPKNKKWRDIKTNLLIKLGAKICHITTKDSGHVYKRLWLPVHINGQLRGYIKARFRKHPDYPSYINAKGPWSRTNGLFPFDPAIALMREIGSKTIVLVEGQRDALRLISEGVPAMCILGTQSWSDTKAKLLELAGVRRVVLLMDGDCAGIDATKMLRPKLRQMFKVVTLKLWSMEGSPYIQFADEPYPSKAAKKADVTLWDPGNMPQWIIKRIKRKYYHD
jgi:5S rRNA maturation endonuclease (ribonuclease M5)